MLKNKFLLSLLVSLSVASVLSLLFSAGFLSAYNTRVSDSLYGGKAALNDIVIIGIDDRSLQEIGRWPWNRSVHAQLVKKLESARLVAFDIAFFEASEDDKELENAIRSARNIVLVDEYTDFSFRNGSLYGESLLRQIFPAPSGFANIFTDSDGIVRSAPLHIEGVENRSSFAAAILELFGPDYAVAAGDAILVNYAGGPKTFRHYSYADVLSNRANISEFDVKIVLVGATAADLRDTYITPVSSTPMAGVEIHANVLQTLITRSFLSRQSQLSVMAVIFILSLLAGINLQRLRLSLATAVVFAAGAAYILAAVILFDSGVLLNIIYPLLALSAGYVSNVAVFYVYETKQRRLVTNIFGKYVSAEVAKEILKHGTEELALKGEKREITVMFTDIRGFTSFSEKLSPDELLQFLNRFLSSMTEVILRKRGIVDKYIGDAIMAFWGAPLKEERHAELACEAALEMAGKLKEMSGVSIGIGINTGEAVVGNMGSAQRLNYTAIGDSVNTASRIEGLNKEYGTVIIIGESTYRQVKGRFACRRLDLIRVKGREKPINIYELVGRKADVDAKTRKFIEHFHAGLELYSRKKWPGAVREFGKALGLKEDKASRIFIERCTKLSKSQPKKWDGVYTMKTK